MSTVTNYLDRILDPVTTAFTPEFAEAVVNLQLDDETQRHVGELRDKANHGTLTAEENEDYRAFVDAVDVISVIQSKARRYLASRRS
jgi:hypothetical protein